MARADSAKLLKKIETHVGNRVRNQVARQYTTVTFTTKGVAEGFKEGYESIREKLQDDYIEFTDSDYKQMGRAAVKAVYNWASKDKTTPHEVVFHSNDMVTYVARRDVLYPYTAAKNAAMAVLQKLRTERGKRRLQGKTINDRTASTSEIGRVKSKVHKLHKDETTVGAARLAASMDFLTRTKDFAGFANSKAATDIMKLFKQVEYVWDVSGTKAKGAQVSLAETLTVKMIVSSMSDNPAGGEPFDWKNLGPVFEKAVTDYLEEANIVDQKGSKSIKQNAMDQSEHLVVDALSKVTGAKVARRTKSSKRKKSTTSHVAKSTQTGLVGSSKKAKVRTRKRVQKSIGSSPLQLMVMINKELPDTVRKNMKSPALVNRTGRFAESVKITDVMQTPQGFPSFGYTYARDPYEVFEMGSGNVRATPERDPRQLIDRSIREIAAQFALGRFYTRRQ